MKRILVAIGVALLTACLVWQVIEEKRRYPGLPAATIASALLGFRLERLEQAPPGALHVKSVTKAFAHFRDTFDTYPQGGNIEIARALLGENARRTVFLDNYKERFTNTSGALADPWDTPLLIQASLDEQVVIRSAGPDRVFWSADDVFLH